MSSLSELLEASAALHKHLCSRQALGIRMGLFAGELLGLTLPQSDKRLLTIAETDGCATDGIAVATNCRVGRRTLRIEDYGKVAATFVDTHTGRALRIVPRAEARRRARAFAPEARSGWEAMLLGYQRMPAADLLAVQAVQLTTPVAHLLSRPSVRTACEVCGEEIMNEREVRRDGATLCRACAGEGYYLLTVENAPLSFESPRRVGCAAVK